MTKEDFLQGLAEFDVIPGKGYTKKQHDALWYRLQYRDGAQFIEACHALAATETRPPALVKFLEQMGHHESRSHSHCTRCMGGYIPFFRVRTVTAGDDKYQSGSFAVARCSCPAGEALWDRLQYFDHIPEFRDEPHLTHAEYGQAALRAEDGWLRNVHWPRMLKQLPPGRHRRAIQKALGGGPAASKDDTLPF